jgi:hypothetical protein
MNVSLDYTAPNNHECWPSKRGTSPVNSKSARNSSPYQTQRSFSLSITERALGDNESVVTRIGSSLIPTMNTLARRASTLVTTIRSTYKAATSLITYTPVWEVVFREDGMKREKLDGQVWISSAKFGEGSTPSVKLHWYIEACVTIRNKGIDGSLTFYLQAPDSGIGGFGVMYRGRGMISLDGAEGTVPRPGVRVFFDDGWISKPLDDVWKKLCDNVQGPNIANVLFDCDLEITISDFKSHVCSVIEEMQRKGQQMSDEWSQDI